MDNQVNNQSEGFWKLLLSIALPISFQSLILSSLNMIDQLMVGQLGDSAVVAIGFASKNFGIAGFIIMGLAGGLGILYAQMIGNGQKERLKKIQGMVLATALVVAVAFCMIAIFLPEQCMRIFSDDESVISEGIRYHKAIALSYIPFAITVTFTTVLRTSKHVKLPMCINISTIFINTLLNYTLIFGNFGMPALGVQGAAIATTITRCMEMVVLLSIVYGRKLPGSYKIKELLCFLDFDQDVKLLWTLTLPLLASNLSFVLADTVYTATYGNLGTEQTVAVVVVLPLQGLIISFFSGFSAGASVIIGNSLGANKKEFAYRVAKNIIIFALTIPLIMGLCLLLFANQYIGLFKITQQSMHMTQMLMVVMICYLPVKIVNMLMAQGILSSGGETKFLFHTSLFGTWGIGVPLGLIAVHVFHLPIYIVYALITSEEAVRVLLALRKFRSKKWLNNLVKN